MGKFDVFISYNRKKRISVEQLYKNLVEQLKIKIWLDDNEIAGSKIYDEISEGITDSSCFLCCITKDYCESNNCRMEIEYARTLEKDIIVLMLEKLNITEIKGIGMIINPYSRINCYNNGDKWPWECLERITKAINLSLNRNKSIEPSQNNNDLNNSKVIKDVPDKNKLEDDSIDDKESCLFSLEDDNVPNDKIELESSNTENQLFKILNNKDNNHSKNRSLSIMSYEESAENLTLQSFDLLKSRSPSNTISFRIPHNSESEHSASFPSTSIKPKDNRLGFLGSVKSFTTSLHSPVKKLFKNSSRKPFNSDELVYNPYSRDEAFYNIEIRRNVKEVIDSKNYSKKCFRIKKYEKIISNWSDFEKLVKIKGNKPKFNLIEKLNEHFREKGFEKPFIDELLKCMHEQHWPDPIKNEAFRLKNKHIIESYSKSF